MDVGTVQTMRVAEITDNYYRLTKDTVNKRLPLAEATKQLAVGEFIEVFILKNKVTMHLPKLTIDLFEWVNVSKVEDEDLYVDIGTTELVEIANTDLPAFKTVWPQEGDKLYVTMKRNREDKLFVVPAKERQFAHLIHDASNVELNDRISGHVIRTAREGTVILSEHGYRGFIHHSERTKEPRLGELITARVIEVKEDGTLNMSLKPLAHERIDDDRDVILQYLKDKGGEMELSDRSKPEDIRATFHISKSAFKRALGRLMRERKVEQRDGKTFLITE